MYTLQKGLLLFLHYYTIHQNLEADVRADKHAVFPNFQFSNTQYSSNWIPVHFTFTCEGLQSLTVLFC